MGDALGENVIILETDKGFARTAMLTSTASNKCATSPPLNNLRRRLLTNHSAMTADARKRTTMANCDAVRSRLAWGRALTTLGAAAGAATPAIQYCFLLSKNPTFGDTRASSASLDLLRASVAASIIFDT